MASMQYNFKKITSVRWPATRLHRPSREMPTPPPPRRLFSRRLFRASPKRAAAASGDGPAHLPPSRVVPPRFFRGTRL